MLTAANLFRYCFMADDHNTVAKKRRVAHVVHHWNVFDNVPCDKMPLII
jgi:hypothetical protein